MADINKAFEAVVKPYEGFYSNTPGDKGGETVYGISRVYNATALLWPLVDAYKTKPGFPENMKDDHTIINIIISVYKFHYWDKLNLDKANDQRIANELFDICINCGADTAGKFLQRVLNVFNRQQKDYADLIVDGIVGSKTIAILNDHADADKVLKALNALQGERYISLCEGCPLYENFINGWITRVQL